MRRTILAIIAMLFTYSLTFAVSQQLLTGFGKPYFETKPQPQISIDYTPLFPISLWHHTVLYSKEIHPLAGSLDKRETMFLTCPLCGPNVFLSRPVEGTVDYITIKSERISYDAESFRAKNDLFDFLKKEINADTLIATLSMPNGPQ